MDKAALACNGLVVFKEEPFHGIRVAAVGFQNGQLVLHCAVLHLHNARDARREVGGIRLKGARAQRLGKALARGQVVVYRIRLVAVGHDGCFAQHAHGRVDDEGRVLQLGGVRRFGNDAAVLRGEHAVAAVCAAAHDKIGDDGAFAVLRPSQHDAAAGVCIYGKLRRKAQMVHILLLFPRRGGSVRRVQFLRQLRQRPGQQLPFRLLHHALLQRFRRIAGQHVHGLLQQDASSVRHFVHKMHRRARHLHALCQRCLMHPQAVVSRPAEAGDQAGVHVQNALGIRGDDAGAQDGQKARQHHHVDAVLPQRGQQRRVVFLRCGIAFARHHNAGHARFGRALQRVHAGL